MAVDVRWATTEDAAALATILCEMAAHYRQAQLDHGRALAAARHWLTDESPAYPHFALAFAGGEVAGLASVAIAHPGIDLERLMFLKDLFVREGARNQGAGRALIAFLAGHCLSHGIGRIDLTTEDWNDGARRFYTQLGAERHGQKIFLRLSGEALKTVAKS
ncbi:GNAT family N-acetyltransferase [Mesorhizobium sp. M4B.F.Ca.ET.190.01.1.1]|uniref:GNAT family N-acetyltransferase n=2 Tax=Mesorhizobium TaxID=68287 RepID=A0ABU5AR28_9HYPH|nr:MULTISPECIES: GNAT family N-acetyltransferase [Mesorhizobium]MDX8539745.1 GNAT family N-acetyltransferase [Mesorhizobium abyssinicae]TGQ29103.1 GNAT family N-acetyltransferase [Mesorhizobium sp. M4B.F.Ca.ET.214.01.1.1]TGQ56298.1 GNAT family N-acetyltransferase [Mesorhizobium sp. M4B.F.Ca.ET.211.01.1.1]TGQ99960.1 GNAT family N-acetyltransferase [Mesorhizobium sp. M4B.F.Ca.ET.200.01.1.1]TGS12077.1 GNAT family N-acetyltransferase [Mesorhizobium sp. M4B.F.Ca.ET.190.01.1.1]